MLAAADPTRARASTTGAMATKVPCTERPREPRSAAKRNADP